MTTPTNYGTPYRLINDAMTDAGLLRPLQVPTGEQIAKYTLRLTDLIMLWQTQGLKLWSQSDQSVTLVAGTSSYALGPSGAVDMTRPLRVLEGYYLDSNSVKRPLIPLSRNDYTRLSTNVTQGAVSQYFVDKLRTQLVIYPWLVPDTTAATGTLHLILQQQIARFSGLTDTIDLPIEWYTALRWGLADEICTGQPEAIMSRCAVKAAAFRQALEDWDVEDAATQFQPDSRGQHAQSSFR